MKSNLKFILSTTILIIPFLGQAKAKNILKSQPKTEEISLEAQAQKAFKAPIMEKKKMATDSQVTNSGLLVLKDPKPEVKGRSFDYTMSIKMQPYQPSGVATNDLKESFNLKNASVNLLPQVEFGVKKTSFQNVDSKIDLGLVGALGFLSQEAKTSLKSGYKINDSRINSSLVELGAESAVQFYKYPKYELMNSIRLGHINYTQTSSNSFAQFSKSELYASLSAGSAYLLENNWKAFLEYTYRQSFSASTVSIQNHNISLGSRIIW